MAEVIKDLGLIDMIDVRLVPDRQEEITPGEAVAGMILNGLGCANRPLSLTPQCFANKPLDLLCREGVGAEMFQERAAALIATFQNSSTPRYLVADATLYNEANAANLQALGCITRMPHTLTLVSQVITPALRWDTWPRLDDTTRDQRVELSHYGMAQRWVVVSSESDSRAADGDDLSAAGLFRDATPRGRPPSTVSPEAAGW